MQPKPEHVAILEVVSAIPRGHVMTYGGVARAAGLPRRARLVGRLLRDLPDGSDVPWFRVVNARGELSEREDTAVARQRGLLEAEGVAFDERGRLNLEIYEAPPVPGMPRRHLRAKRLSS